MAYKVDYPASACFAPTREAHGGQGRRRHTTVLRVVRRLRHVVRKTKRCQSKKSRELCTSAAREHSMRPSAVSRIVIRTARWPCCGCSHVFVFDINIIRREADAAVRPLLFPPAAALGWLALESG